MFKERPDPADRIVLKPTERQIRWMRFLNLHGALPSQYLFDLEGEKNVAERRAAQKQLQRLWLGGFINRPRRLWETANANYNHYCYDLTEQGKQFLRDRELWVDAARPTGNAVHQLFVSTVTATMDIMCQRAGYRFIPQHEYLAGKPATVQVPFAWNDRRYTLPLAPDALFAIDYGGDSYLAFALEADRDTETSRATSTSPERKSDLRTIRQYAAFIDQKLYKRAYDREAQMVMLFITVTETKVARFLKLLAEEGSSRYVAVGLVSEFDRPFKPPVLLKHLFEGELLRADAKPFTIKKPA